MTRWDNVNLYSHELPLHVLWKQRNCQSDPVAMHPLMQKIIAGVKVLNGYISALQATLADSDAG